MTEKIEGLSIGLDLDTLALDRGLTGLKDKLKTVNSEMKANMSAFERGDKSIERYETSLMGLNKKLEVQKRVVSEAKSEHEKMVKEFGEGSKEAEKAAREYNNQVASLNSLQRYINKTETELKELRQELNKSEFSWTNLGQTIQNTGRTLSGIGSSLTVGLTTPILGAGLAIGKVASDFDEATGRIEARLGVTKQRAEELSKVAQDVWKNGFGESVRETADAITVVNNNLKDLSDEELKEATNSAFLLQEAFDAELNESTRAAGQLMKDFGDDSSKAFDLLTWGFQNGLDYTGEFLDTIREYSPQFAEMGYTSEQMLNALKDGFDAGSWSLDKLGDSIKESHLRMTDMSKATKDAYKSLGLSAEEYAGKIAKGGTEGNKAFQEVVEKLQGVEDATERNLLATDLFGTQYEDLREKVIFSMTGASKSIEGLEGTTKRASDAIQDNFGTRVTKTWREFVTDLEPAGEILLDLAEDVLPKVADTVNDVTSAFSEMDPQAQKTVLTIGGIAAAIGPVSLGLGLIFKTTGMVTKGLGVGVGAFNKYIGSTKAAKIGVNDFGNTAHVTSGKIQGANTTIGKTSKELGGLKGGAGLATTALTNVGTGADKTTGKLAGMGTKVLGTVKNISGLSKILGVARIGLGALGGPIGLLTKVGLPLLIQGGVKLFNHLKNDSIPVVEDFGDKVSDSTTKAVLSYKNLNDEATTQLNNLYWSSSQVTDKMAEEITGTFSEMGNQIKTSLKSNLDESYGFFSDYFNKSTALSALEEQTILKNAQDRYNRQIETVQLQEAKIKEIMDLASQQKRVLTEEEKLQINTIQQNMMNTAVQTMSKSEVEQKAIMERLKNESGNITAQQAATTVQNSLKAKEGAVKEANDKYNQTIAAIIRERDETGTISADQARKLIVEAERQRDESVKAATEMHNRVVEQAKLQAGGQADQIDWTSGEVLSNWDLMLRGSAKTINAMSSGINWVLDKIGINTKIPMWEPKGYNSNKKSEPYKSRRATGNMELYAKGTPSSGHPGGPAIVGEEGRELAHIPGKGITLLGTRGAEYHSNLPKGTSVLPNKHTERLLKSYGFPGYEDGVGSFFDWALKGPKYLQEMVWKKFNVSMDTPGGALTTLGNGIMSFLNDKTLQFFKSKIEGLFDFGGSVASGNVKSWIAQAMSITGVPASWASALSSIAMKESGGNPTAVNNWDINAKRGIPSKGLMQTIGPTFDAYKLPGLNDILNPVHNAVAAIRYIQSRYGSVFNVPGIKSMSSGGAYKGYATGGLIGASGLYQLAEEGWPEFVIPTDPNRRTDAMKLLALAGKQITKNKRPNQLPNVSPSDENNRLLQAVLEQNRILMALLQSSRNIENKPVLTQNDIGLAVDNYNANQTIKNNIYSGRPAY